MAPSESSLLPGPLHAPGASLPFKIMGGLASLGILFVLVGFLLPGTWTAHAASVLDAPPEKVFPYLSSPSRWDAWTPWGSVDSSLDGPASGPGARRSWSDREQGEGTMEIVGVELDREVRYRVEVDGGSIRIQGHLKLEGIPGGTRVDWVESGDFGWNPVLAYMALFMKRSQGAQMAGNLRRLGEVVATARPPS